MENDNKEIAFRLVECDLIPNGRGMETNLTLSSTSILTPKVP